MEKELKKKNGDRSSLFLDEELGKIERHERRALALLGPADPWPLQAPGPRNGRVAL